jgi:hypothetical protein
LFIPLTLPPSVSRLSRQNVGASTSHNPMAVRGIALPYIVQFTVNLTVGNRRLTTVDYFRIWIFFFAFELFIHRTGKNIHGYEF